jgi:hypothetical protein
MADSPASPDTPDAVPTPPGPPTEEEILADSRLHELLAGYKPLHNEIFLKGYARLLADLHNNGEVYEQNLEYLLHQHDKQAGHYLWMIQHQKLFDLECQWRAGLVEVPGARLTADFEDWHNYIEECPVLPPISPDEVELLSEFMGQSTDDDDLQNGNPADSFWLHRRHPRLRDDDDDEDLRSFTQYWDLRCGTGYLRELPDLRGDLEHRYQKASRDEHSRQHPYVAPPADPRPYVPTYGPAHDDLMREYLRRFQPAAKLRQYEIKLQLEDYDASEDRLDLPLALERLQNAGPILIPIEAHADWRQAVIAAGHRHYLDQLRAALPQVYDDYCQRQRLGIAHTPPEERRFEKRGGAFKHLDEQIRHGRRLLGEPDDLDF